jgi:hypothetical protein
VLHGCRVDIRLLFLVARKAKILGTIGFEVVPELAAMGVVTLGAGLLDRGVEKLLAFECLGLIGMAFETDGIDGCPQQLGEIRLVHVVAGGATADGNRAMDELALHDGTVMTLEAEFRPGRAKLVFVGGLVGIVTGEAFSLFDRSVHVLMGIKPLVAFGAQLARVLYCCK